MTLLPSANGRRGCSRPLLVECLESRFAPAVFTWNGSTDQLWSTAANWNGGFAPPTDGTADLVFPAASPLLNPVNDFASAIFRSVTVRDEYTLMGQGIFLTTGGFQVDVPAQKTVFLRQNLVISGQGQSISASNAKSLLRIDSAIQTLNNTITFSGAGNIVMTNVIDGPGNVVKIDQGSTTLLTGTTFTGSMTVNDGLLIVQNDDPTFNSLQGKLIVGDDIGAAESARVRVSFASASTTLGDVVVQSDGVLELFRNTTKVSSLTIGTSSGGGRIEGAGTLQTARDIVINPAPTTSVIDAPLNVGIGITRIFTIPDGAAAVDLELSGTLSGSSKAGSESVPLIVKNGPGALRISSTNDYSGLVRLDDGVLLLAATSKSITGVLQVGDGVGGPGSTTAMMTQDAQFPTTGQLNVLSDGVFDLSGFSTSLDTIAGVGTIQLNTGTLTFGMNNGSSLFDGTVLGAGKLVKTGTGLITISKDQTYTADTIVQNGQLRVLGSVASANFGVELFGTLGGTGKLGNVTISGGGILAPGTDNTGVLHTGTVTFSSGSYQVRLNGNTRGTGYDALDVVGSVTLTGSKLDATLNYLPTLNTTFTLIDNDGKDAVVGTFVGQAEGSVVLIGGQLFSVSYKGGDGNDVVLTRSASIGTTIRLATSPNPVIAGQQLLLTATITPATNFPQPVSGFVEFRDGTSVIGTVSVATGGVASLITTIQTAGTRSLTANYLGDANYLPSVSLAIQQNVGAAGVPLVPTATSISVTPNPSVSGQEVTVIATVAPTASSGTLTGVVNFFDGDTFLRAINVTGSTATYITSGLSVGTHTIRAVYVGSAVYATSNSQTITLTVTGIASVPPPPLPNVPPVVTPPVTPPTTPPVTPPTTPPVVPPTTPPVVPPATPPTTPPVTPPTTPPFVAPIGIPLFALGYATPNGGRVRLATSLGTQTGLSAIDNDPAYANGVHVAFGDVTGDGIDDIVVGAGPGGGSRVTVYDGVTSQVVFAFNAYEDSFVGGVFVALGDINADGFMDVITSPDQGGGGRIRVIGGRERAQLADFFGIDDPDFRGGARVAAGDVTGDGVADVLVGAGFGGGPRVAIYDGAALQTGNLIKPVGDFFVFEQSLRNGVYLTAGDLDGDGFADVIVGGGPGGGPRVFALSGRELLAGNQVTLANFFAGDTSNRGGVRVAVTDVDGDNRADLITAPGPGGGNTVRTYRGSLVVTRNPGTPIFNFVVNETLPDGIYVG